MQAERIIDLSHPVDADTPVYPGDGAVRITRLEQPEAMVSRVELSVHTGTHMDAPCHFIGGGAAIDQIPLERCVGPARIIDLRGIAAGSGIRREHLPGHCDTRAVLLHTGWSKQWGTEHYFRDHPCLDGDAARFLVERGVQLVGVDMPSVDQAPYEAHRALLGAGVLIVENLTNLESIGAELFHFIVLPLKLAGRDGSPVRAVAVV